MDSRVRERPCLKRSSPSLDFSTNVQVHPPTHTTHARIPKNPLASVSPSVAHTCMPVCLVFLPTFHRQIFNHWLKVPETKYRLPLMWKMWHNANLSVDDIQDKSDMAFHWQQPLSLVPPTLSAPQPEASLILWSSNAVKLFSCQLLDPTGRRLDTVRGISTCSLPKKNLKWQCYKRQEGHLEKWKVSYHYSLMDH